MSPATPPAITDVRLNCPVCGSEAQPAPAVCPQCGAPLSAYWRALLRPWTQYERARELAADGRTAAASRHACAAVEMEPGRWQFHLLLARLLCELQEWDEALQRAQTAQDLYPQSDEIDDLVADLMERKLAAQRPDKPGSTPPTQQQ